MPGAIVLHGMTWSDPRGHDPVVAGAAAFAEAHPGLRIEWEKRSLQGFESTPVKELAAAYDLMIIDHPHTGAAVSAGCLLPIDRHATPDALTRLAAETVGKSYQSYAAAGHQWALPVDAACQVQAVRPDLIAGPLHDWPTVIKEARAGRVVWPLRPPHVLMSFFTLLANIGAPFPVTRDARLDRQAGRTVLQAMQALCDTVDPACLGMDPIAALDALSRGTRFAVAPLTYLYAPYGRVDYRPHRIAFHEMPVLGQSGPLGSALGGTGIAISAHTRHPELCTEFALWIASANVQRGLYAANNGQPGNAVAWGDSGVNETVGNAYMQTRMTHEAAWLRPRHAGYMSFQDEGSQILLDTLAGRVTHDNALHAMQVRFDESFPDEY